MRKIRVLTAKLGFDLHNRGINVVNRVFRDSGMEVIFIGNQFPEIIAETALQENVDVIGTSCLNSATSIEFMTRLMDILREKGIDDTLVVFGGIIIPDDVPRLKEIGVARYFPPGSDLDLMVNFIKDNVT